MDRGTARRQRRYGIHVPAAANRRLVAGVHATISTSWSPPRPSRGGILTGDGLHTPGATATLTAMAIPGYIFKGWTENGTSVSTMNSSGSCGRCALAGRQFRDGRVPTPIEISTQAPGMAFSMEWSLVPAGWILEESPNWLPVRGPTRHVPTRRMTAYTMWKWPTPHRIKCSSA